MAYNAGLTIKGQRRAQSDPRYFHKKSQNGYVRTRAADVVCSFMNFTHKTRVVSGKTREMRDITTADYEKLTCLFFARARNIKYAIRCAFDFFDSVHNFCSKIRYLSIEDGSVTVRLLTSGFFNQGRSILYCERS